MRTFVLALLPLLPFTACTWSSTVSDFHGHYEQAGVVGMRAYEEDLHLDYDFRYAHTGLTYEQVRHAYRFGYKLAKDPQYSASNWENVEPIARSNWENGFPGSWIRYKHAIYYGWQLGSHGRN